MEVKGCLGHEDSALMNAVVPLSQKWFSNLRVLSLMKDEFTPPQTHTPFSLDDTTIRPPLDGVLALDFPISRTLTLRVCVCVRACVCVCVCVCVCLIYLYVYIYISKSG
jgi:hypothetical protein